jgi:hypothetical protein
MTVFDWVHVAMYVAAGIAGICLLWGMSTDAAPAWMTFWRRGQRSQTRRQWRHDRRSS